MITDWTNCAYSCLKLSKHGFNFFVFIGESGRRFNANFAFGSGRSIGDLQKFNAKSIQRLIITP